MPEWTKKSMAAAEAKAFSVQTRKHQYAIGFTRRGMFWQSIRAPAKQNGVL